MSAACISPTPYMTPETARALLAESRRRTAFLRARREWYRQAREIGFPDSAAMELADIGARNTTATRSAA